jgi:hypothetical protein
MNSAQTLMYLLFKISGFSTFPELALFPSQVNRIRKKVDYVESFGTATHKPWLNFVSSSPIGRSSTEFRKAVDLTNSDDGQSLNYEFKQRITPSSVTVQTTLTFNQDF